MLSKVYIFDIRNNILLENKNKEYVVNCFQKFISLIFETTKIVVRAVVYWLWIAFKSLYLWYSKQLRRKFSKATDCCELLSKVYIFDIRNNKKKFSYSMGKVVNCFQKFISLIFETTYPVARFTLCSCELLSKVYIFDIRNNKTSY